MGALVCFTIPGFSQATKQLTPDDFEKMSKSWSEVSDIKLDPGSDTYQVEEGEGVLVNLPGKKKGEDIRTKEEFDAGHLEGSINISWQDITALKQAIGSDKHRQVVLYCRSGNRSGKAVATLKSQGYTNLYNGTGLEALRATKP